MGSIESALAEVTEAIVLGLCLDAMGLSHAILGETADLINDIYRAWAAMV